MTALAIQKAFTKPCLVNLISKDTHLVFSIYFSAENSNSAKTVVHGIIGGVPVPFPVPADCCANKNLKCPITSGTTDIYTNSIFCSPQYPKVSEDYFTKS